MNPLGEGGAVAVSSCPPSDANVEAVLMSLLHNTQTQQYARASNSGEVYRHAYKPGHTTEPREELLCLRRVPGLLQNGALVLDDRVRPNYQVRLPVTLWRGAILRTRTVIAVLSIVVHLHATTDLSGGLLLLNIQSTNNSLDGPGAFDNPSRTTLTRWYKNQALFQISALYKFEQSFEPMTMMMTQPKA